MGEVVLVLLGLAFLGYLLVAPAVALALAIGADRRSKEIEKRLFELSSRKSQSAHEKEHRRTCYLDIVRA